MDWEKLRFWKEGWPELRDRLVKKSFVPKKTRVFRAFEKTPFNAVRVVILGQDPYPTPGHADGLAFSVPPDVRPIPQTLYNIFAELVADIHCPWPSTGCLDAWAEDGILLLNTSLTLYREEQANSVTYSTENWEPLIREVLETLSEDRTGLSFVLWGNYAKSYADSIKHQAAHQILTGVHPSPRSAQRGFFGSRPFSSVNIFQSDMNDKPVNWRLP